ncbi:hypothetical protein KUCAC02_017013, partial [Chaenocephalus aceratus]
TLTGWGRVFVADEEEDCIETCVERYKAEPTMPWRLSSTVWSKHEGAHSKMAGLARKYLATPATSVRMPRKRCSKMRRFPPKAVLPDAKALIRHKLSCVCTWKASVLDSIQEEGRKLNIEKLGKGVDSQCQMFDSANMFLTTQRPPFEYTRST